MGANIESKYGLNETAIDVLTAIWLRDGKMPNIKRYQTEAIIQATLYSPGAKKVGFIDEVVDQTALEQRAIDIAEKCAELPAKPTAR